MSWHTVANQRGLKIAKKTRKSILIRSRIKGKGRAVDPDRRSLQPSKKNIQHFKKWNLVTFFYVCWSFSPSWIRIRIANPDPDTDPGTPLNPDAIRIRIWIRIHGTGKKHEILSAERHFYPRVADPDPDSIGTVDPDPYSNSAKMEGKKWPPKVEKI